MFYYLTFLNYVGIDKVCRSVEGHGNAFFSVLKLKIINNTQNIN